MEHWGFNTMSKKVTMLTLAAAFTVGVAACGGGGGSSSSSTSSGSVSGLAVEGPVGSASIIVYNADGTTCSAAGTTTSSADATFSLNIGTCTPPLAIELSGGTDSVHSTMGVTVPQANMRSIVGSTSQSVANISPFSTLIYYALVKDSANLAAAGVTTSNVASSITTSASTVLTNFGFGVDSNTDGTSNSSFNPITATLGSTNYATFIQAAEALSETVRRVAKQAGSVSSSNIGSIFALLGKDLSDSTLDGNAGTTALSSGITGFDMASVRAYAQSYALFVLNEVFSSAGLNVTDKNGSATSALSAIKSAVLGVNKNAVNSFDSVKASTIATAQWDKAKTAALALYNVTSLSQLGISSDLTTSTAVGSRPLTFDSSRVAALSADVSAANNAFVNAATFNVTLSTVTLTDYPSNTATTLTPSTPSISSGVLTVSLPSTSTVSASNLNLLASVDAASTTATPPVINFNLKSVPAGSGTAGVTMSLLDGTDSTRSSGERAISASFNVPWSSNGTTLTLSKPTGASVTYYNMTATSASTATLSNTAVGSLMITSSGSSQVSGTGGLKFQIAELFNTATKHGGSALATALKGTSSAGSYVYSIDFSGIALSGTPANSSTASTFSRVQGSFTAK
ncbi:MAG: hypothetical protein HQL07_06905 [Nitrospirae bacterium]|nr:hypothetical protein [Magnetococcales bacterium]HAT49244.1 hypothetical protein [Alphaproteobacteria bacterium]